MTALATPAARHSGARLRRVSRSTVFAVVSLLVLHALVSGKHYLHADGGRARRTAANHEGGRVELITAASALPLLVLSGLLWARQRVSWLLLVAALVVVLVGESHASDLYVSGQLCGCSGG